MSKDLKPKQKLGRSRLSLRQRLAVWSAVAAVCAAAGYAFLHYTGTTEVDVAVARVRRGDFVVSVKTRGEIRSVRSVVLTAPQVPDPRIVKLAETGRPIKKGDVVVEFDGVQQEQNHHRKKHRTCVPPTARSCRPRRSTKWTTRWTA